MTMKHSIRLPLTALCLATAAFAANSAPPAATGKPQAIAKAKVATARAEAKCK